MSPPTAQPARRLAAVLAHPDDESRIMGGTLALAARRGWRVTLYCATAGEAGDPEMAAAAVAELRERELGAACRTLGIEQFHLGRLPDGGLADTDPDVVVEDVVRHLRTVRPEVVVTFGPDGRTGHPDHVTIGRLTEAAFRAAGDPARYPGHRPLGLASWQPERLYHTAMARSVAETLGWPHPSLPDDDLVRVDVTETFDVKRRAVVEAHASQWRLSPWNLTAGWAPRAVEHFRLARSEPGHSRSDGLL
jgi:LmbE family N-acetylglucosaminyl deacetylase